MGSTGSMSAHGEYAGYSSRLAAFLIDSVVIAAVSLFVAWAAVELFDVVGINLRDCDQTAERRPLLASICHWLLYLGPLAGTAIMLGYTLFFWSATGQTPGKAAMGVRIVRLNGRPMNLVTAVRRLAGYLLSLWPLGLGFHVILADDRRQGWHDKIAGTVVVYSWGVPDERPTLRSPRSERRRAPSPIDDGPS